MGSSPIERVSMEDSEVLKTYLWMTQYTLEKAQELESATAIRNKLGTCIKSLGTAIQESSGQSKLVDLVTSLQEYLVHAAEGPEAELKTRVSWILEKLKGL